MDRNLQSPRLAQVILGARQLFVSNSDYTKLVPKPSAESVNSGRSPLSQSAVMGHFGEPAAVKTVNCGNVSNSKLSKALVTQSVGVFRVTGHKAAVADLVLIFASIKAADPDLYKLLGSAGMLCVRKVRGGDAWSNHSWGFAIDLTIAGMLDKRGDDMVQQGLLDLYKHFHKQGWFWGIEFHTEDSMHFEMSLERFNELKNRGVI